MEARQRHRRRDRNRPMHRRNSRRSRFLSSPHDSDRRFLRLSSSSCFRSHCTKFESTDVLGSSSFNGKMDFLEVEIEFGQDSAYRNYVDFRGNISCWWTTCTFPRVPRSATRSIRPVDCVPWATMIIFGTIYSLEGETQTLRSRKFGVGGNDSLLIKIMADQDLELFS